MLTIYFTDSRALARLSSGPANPHMDGFADFLHAQGYAWTTARNLGAAWEYGTVDSRNHFWTSLLVCGGILLSFFAQLWDAYWLFYADAVASAFIGLMILRGAVELVQELLKERWEGTEISHFMRRTQERTREKILLKWLSGKLQSGSLTSKELEEKFKADFCEQTPKILILSGMGYRPESGADLHHYLRLFVEQKRLVLDEGRYWFISRS